MVLSAEPPKTSRSMSSDDANESELDKCFEIVDDDRSSANKKFKCKGTNCAYVFGSSGPMRKFIHILHLPQSIKVVRLCTDRSAFTEKLPTIRAATGDRRCTRARRRGRGVLLQS